MCCFRQFNSNNSKHIYLKCIHLDAFCASVLYSQGGAIKKHPNKEIRAAIDTAVLKTISVWSTPKNPAQHAQRILKKISECDPENK